MKTGKNGKPCGMSIGKRNADSSTQSTAGNTLSKHRMNAMCYVERVPD
jgi:hypothetical protein